MIDGIDQFVHSFERGREWEETDCRLALPRLICIKRDEEEEEEEQ